MTPFQILGIPEGSTEEEIKKAYKNLARQHHPDLHKGNKEAEEKFKELSNAYETLKNNNWKYNPAPQMSGGFGGFGHFDINDIFNSFNIGFNPFQETKRQIKRRKGQIHITFEEAFNGCEKDIQVNSHKICEICNGMGVKLKNTTCPNCHGNGKTRSNYGNMILSSTCNKCNGYGREIENVCGDCKGSGKKVETQEIKVKIPSQILNGTILFPEKDLELIILFKQHPEYTLINDGVDIGSKVSINICQAILGDSININTLMGVKKIKIPEGIQSGTILKINGGGFKINQNSKSGDHFVEVAVKTPINLTEEHKKIFEELKKTF